VGADGKFEISAPDGTGAVTLPGDVPTQDAGEVVVAADGRSLVTTSGKEMYLSSEGLSFTGDAVPLRPGQSVAALADGNRAVITVGSGAPATYPVYATHFGQPSISLGQADSVAGDPQQTGAIVSVGSSQLPNFRASGLPDGNLELPMMDVRVELRYAGHPTVSLDRASQINAALHQPPNTPVHIVVVPSPTGQLFALEVLRAVIPSGFDAPQESLVVVDRQGTIVGTAIGLNGTVGWSPDGQSLAYPQVAAQHLDIAMWTIGHQPELHQGPTAINGSRLTCLWAPTSRAVLCVVTAYTERSVTWLIAQRHRSHVATYKGPFWPLAWLPGPTPAR
jgi:hypothetical protein